MNTVADNWLANAKNQTRFGSHDGLPGPYHREALYNSIRHGTEVMIETPHGSRLTGRAVMLGPAGWVLNLGGPHGTPGIASEENVIWVTGASKVLGFKD
jgi:hypothetical protein